MLTDFFSNGILPMEKTMVEETKPTTDKKTDPKNRQLTLEEYKAFQAKEAKKFKGIKLPLIAKIILSLPLFAIAIFGIIFISFLIIKSFGS